MDLYLIRHTTPEVAKGICYGQSDLRLADTFEEDYKALTSHIPPHLDQVYSSPLQRCALLAHRLIDQPVFDDRLKEMDFGDWEMQPWNDIPKEELNPWMADFVNVAVPNGESFDALIKRSLEALAFIEKQAHEQVAVVTHAGVIRACLGHLLGMKPQNYFRLQIDYGGLTKVTVSKGHYGVQYINR